MPQHKLEHIILIILLVITAIGSFFVYHQVSEQQKTIIQQQEIINNLTSQISTFSSDERRQTSIIDKNLGSGTSLNLNTSTWKTYRNEEYGFEFRYPSIYSESTLSISYGSYGGKEFFGSIYTYGKGKYEIFFGGQTPDFSEGRGASLTDFYRFVENENGYELKGSIIPAGKQPTAVWVNQNGTKILYYFESIDLSADMSGDSKVFCSFAFVNLKHREFNGLALATCDDSFLGLLHDREEFKEIAKSINVFYPK